MANEPKPLNEVLGRALGRPEVVRLAKALRAMEGWVECVGPLLAKKSKPTRFANGTLWVTVTSASWAQELGMRRRELLSRLNRVSDGAFQDIRLVVGSIQDENLGNQPSGSEVAGDADEDAAVGQSNIEKLRNNMKRALARLKAARRRRGPDAEPPIEG